MSSEELPGAFVISLDFELAWGLGKGAAHDEARRARILGARAIIPELLETFEEFDVAATWAVVGFLFAESRVELERLLPEIQPQYPDSSLMNSIEEIGEDESEDPLHFAPSLIRAILATPRQEIATHTFSHYYCLERGQSRETFTADLRAARAIAKQIGVKLRSIVFPRNQHNPDYDDILLEHGITSYRGNPRNWAWRFRGTQESRNRARRAMRLIDAYGGFTGTGPTRWTEVLQPSGLADIRATRLLSPYRPAMRYLEGKRMRRIRSEIRRAARNREIFHIWWHPHNFSDFPKQNMVFLRGLLEEVVHCRSEHGLRCLSMANVDGLVRKKVPRKALIIG